MWWVCEHKDIMFFSAGLRHDGDAGLEDLTSGASGGAPFALCTHVCWDVIHVQDEWYGVRREQVC